eukprot:630629_1
MRCVRSNEIFYKSNAMYGFRMTIPKEVKNFINDSLVAAPLPDSVRCESEDLDTDLLDSVRASLSAPAYYAPTVYACVQALQEGDVKDADLAEAAKVVLTCAVLQSRASLKTRFLESAGGAGDMAEIFLELFTNHARAALGGCMQSELGRCADILDVPFFFNIFELLRGDSSLSLSGEASSELESLWATVKKETGSKFKLLPLVKSKNVADSSAASTNGLIPQTCALHKINAPVVNTVVPDLEGALAKRGLIANEPVGEPMIPKGWERDALIPDGLRHKSEELEEAKQQGKLKRLQKNDQRYLAFMEKYASSLAGSKIVLSLTTLRRAAELRKDLAKRVERAKRARSTGASRSPTVWPLRRRRSRRRT